MNPELNEHEAHEPAAGPLGGEAIVAWLDERMSSLLQRIEQQPFWRALTSPTTSPALLAAIMREVYLEIFSYQEHAIGGAITAISQMPRSMPVRMVKAMLRHQAEEFDHGEMALRDYVALGGSESHARNVHRASPAAYSVAAIWRMIADQRDPFAYLGALYPFEGLTPIVSARAKEVLLARGYPASALEFVEFHSTEDPKHTELVRHLIRETVTRYPQAERSIQEGLDRFLAIYPIPVWETAYRRALASAQPEQAAA